MIGMTTTNPPEMALPLSVRIVREIAELRERRDHAATWRDFRELTTWIDEAYGELNRALRFEALAKENAAAA